MEARDSLIGLAIANKGNWEKILKDVQNKNTDFENTSTDKCLTLIDADYPLRVKNTFKPPFVLFYKGNIELLKNDNIISVCGTRNPTAEGLLIFNKIVKGIYYAVFSMGLATNTDIIDYVNKPIMVLSCGFDKANDIAVKKVLDKGGLVITEYPLGVDADTNNAQMAIRVQEAIAHKTFVYEVRKHGSGIQNVVFAIGNNHDVFVAPHSINEDFENNKLISDGAFVCESRDALYEKYAD